MDTKGRKVPGILECDNERKLGRLLKEKGLTLVRVSTGPSSGHRGGAGRLKRGNVTTTDRGRFASQMSRFLRSGCPVDQALLMIQGTVETQAMADTVKSIRDGVRQGESMAAALARHHTVFSTLFISSVRAGEEGGFLDKALEKLAEHEQRQARLLSKVKSSMLYPTFMLITLVVVLFVMFYFVVPSLVEFFVSSNFPLPAPTRALIWVSDHVLEIFGGVGGLIFFVWLGFRLVGRSPSALVAQDRLLLALPIFGNLASKINLAQFCSTMALLLSGGVGIAKALEIAREVVSNRFFQNEIGLVGGQVVAGESLSNGMEATAVFPFTIVGQVRFGEEVGQLDAILNQVAQECEQQATEAIDALVGLLEPMMIVLMAVIMGFVVIAMFTPMVTMINSV